MTRFVSISAFCGLLLIPHLGTAALQSEGPRAPATIPRASSPAITGTGTELRVTVHPGIANCRTLIRQIAQLAHLEIRNLERVADDEVYVGFADEPVESAVATLLEYARVDFVLRIGGALDPPLVIVAGPARSTAAAGRILPSVSPVSSDEEPAAAAQVEETAEPVQLGRAPAWRPLNVTPVQVELPAAMIPNEFEISAPPPVPASANTRSDPSQQSVKH